MALNGINKSQLEYKLVELGVDQNNQKKALSLFDEIDKDESIKGETHNDGLLSGLEMHKFLIRVKNFLGDKVKDLRESFIKTGVYAEEEKTQSSFDSNSTKCKYDEKGRVVREFYDNDGDGVYDYGKEREYAEDGTVLSYSLFNDNKRVVSEYNEDGSLKCTLIRRNDNTYFEYEHD